MQHRRLKHERTSITDREIGWLNGYLSIDFLIFLVLIQLLRDLGSCYRLILNQHFLLLVVEALWHFHVLILNCHKLSFGPDEVGVTCVIVVDQVSKLALDSLRLFLFDLLNFILSWVLEEMILLFDCLQLVPRPKCSCFFKLLHELAQGNPLRCRFQVLLSIFAQLEITLQTWKYLPMFILRIPDRTRITDLSLMRNFSLLSTVCL